MIIWYVTHVQRLYSYYELLCVYVCFIICCISFKTIKFIFGVFVTALFDRKLYAIFIEVVGGAYIKCLPT